MENLKSCTKWDERFLEVAKLVAQWSKDPSTQVGAVLVRDKRILATGYNGIPTGIHDDIVLHSERPVKLAYTIHAEINAILNAAKFGIRTNNTTIYITADPCVDCCKSLLQAGITRIVVPQVMDFMFAEKWKENLKLAKTLLSEANLELIRVPMAFQQSTPIQTNPNFPQENLSVHGDKTFLPPSPPTEVTRERPLTTPWMAPKSLRGCGAP